MTESVAWLKLGHRGFAARNGEKRKEAAALVKESRAEVIPATRT